MTTAPHKPSFLSLARWCAVLVGAACACCVRAQDVISLRPSAIIGGSNPLMLRDVAELNGPLAESLGSVVLDYAVVEAGAPGWREVGIGDVRTALEERTDINWGKLILRGAACAVRRTATTPEAPKTAAAIRPPPMPEGQTVRSLVARRLSEILDLGPDDLRLTFDENDRSLLDTPVEGRTADIQLMGTSERQPVAVRLFEGLAVVASGTVRVQVAVRRTVAVSAAPLRRGDIIGPGNMLIEQRWLTPGSRVAPPASVAGTTVRTRLDAGEIIEEKDVEAPVVVKKGDLIDVYCVCGSVSVKTVARALETARTGDLVKMQSPESKRSFLARVDGPGRAVTGDGGPDRSVATDGGAARSLPEAVAGGTEAPASAAAITGGDVAEVGGVRVTRTASSNAKRASAVQRRLNDLADRPLKAGKEQR